MITVLSWEMGIKHEQDLDPDTPTPAPVLKKVKGRCFSAVKHRSVSAEQIESQNRTEVLLTIRAGQHPQSKPCPGSSICWRWHRTTVCWLKDTELLRWKWLETTLAYWVDWGNGWDFLLFCTSLFKNFWGQIRWPQTKDGRPAESTWNILVFFGRLGLSRGRHIYGVCFCLWCGKCLLWVNSEKKSECVCLLWML